MEESRDIADRLAADHPARDRIAQCHTRVEISGDPDPDMTHFNDFVFVCEAVEDLGRVYLFDQEAGAFISWAVQHGANLVSTMLLTLDLSDPRPLHEQIAGALRRAIALGDVQPGDRLPPARDLASALGVNANTALRALRGLRDEGLLEFRRGRGVSVLRLPDAHEVLRDKVMDLLDKADRYGYGVDDVIDIVRELAAAPRASKEA